MKAHWLALLPCLLALAACDGGRNSLSGQIHYQDWLYDQSGLTRRQAKPVRFALVDLLDADGQRLASTHTDAAGRYHFQADIPLRFSLRVLARQDGSTAPAVTVQDLRGDVYAVTKNVERFEPVIDIELPAEASAAFNLFDVYQAAGAYFSELSGRAPQPLAVFWQPGNGDGTYYCSAFANPGCVGGAGIYVLSERNGDGSLYDDRDEYDDDVLLHEYGHFLFARYSRDDSPGGCHSLEANDQDLTLAWSEGWGNFFSAAVKSWMRARGDSALSSSLPASHYIDTVQSATGSGIGISFDFADPERYLAQAADRYFYAGSEVAVANVLWRLFEQQNSLAGLWRIFTAPAWLARSAPVNIEALWDGLLDPGLGHGYSKAGVLPIFQARGLDYTEDEYEPDDRASSVRLLQLQRVEAHTLYRDAGADRDVFAIPVSANVRYRVATGQLRNGADTQMWLYENPDLARVIASNDNLANDNMLVDERCGRRLATTDALASAIEFTAFQDGLYYIAVATSAEPFGFTGRYGGYEISLTQLGP